MLGANRKVVTKANKLEGFSQNHSADEKRFVPQVT